MIDDDKLCRIINHEIADSIVSGSYITDNNNLLDRYNAELYGDEEEGLSQFTTTEVADVVDADMVSLVRVFLGANHPVRFSPIYASEDAIKESEDLNIYIPWIIDNVEDSFRKQFDLLKSIEIQKTGWVEYGVREIEKTETKEYEGISREEFQARLDELQNTDGIDEVEIESEDTENGTEYNFAVKLTRKRKEFFIDNVPWEDMIISRNVQSKQDANIVGRKWRKRRGELVAEGYDKETVKKLPLVSGKDSGQSNRYDSNGYDEIGGTNSIEWQMEMVEGVSVYVLVDQEGEGRLERMHVVKSGDEILHKEPFDHIPFAGGSAIPMPHNIVGKSRAEVCLSQQRIMTVLTRNVNDNIYAVNLGRTYVDDSKVNMDDQHTAVKHGTIRVDGDPRISVMPDIVPYHGDKTLQVIQYLETKHAKRTGDIISNQGLTSDQLHEETATRFEGMQELGEGKIELVARVIAETVYKDLYEGLAWFARHYQDTDQELHVLGGQLTINPSKWRFEHRIKAEINQADESIQFLSGILSLQREALSTGSFLSDEAKIFNTLTDLMKASGRHDVLRYFNNPERPEQLLQAENGVLKRTIQQLQQQVQQNPLAEAELIKAQARMAEVNQRDTLKAQEMDQDMRQFIMKMAQEDEHFRQTLVKELTKLELENGRNVPGSSV